MSDGYRVQLAVEQARVLRALQVGSTPPPGFDSARVTLTGDSLARKRMGSVAKAWPRLCAGLGGEFSQWFSTFARERPSPAPGGPVADGWWFCDWLAERRALGDDAKLERARVRMRFTRGHGGTIVPHRGPGISLTWLSTQRQLAVGFRVWSADARWLRLGPGRRGRLRYGRTSMGPPSDGCA